MTKQFTVEIRNIETIQGFKKALKALRFIGLVYT